MKKHIHKIFAGILAILLLTVALDTKLAQPEANSTANDKFIGFFLAYETMTHNGTVIQRDRSHWVE